MNNDASRVTVDVGEDGFAVEDDGTAPPVSDTERFFDYGDAVPTTEAGMHLPNVRTLARVHGWNATVDTDYQDGVRIEVAVDPAPLALTGPGD